MQLLDFMLQNKSSIKSTKAGRCHRYRYKQDYNKVLVMELLFP